MAGIHKGETMPTRKYLPSLTLATAVEFKKPFSDVELWGKVGRASIDSVDLLQVQDCIEELCEHAFIGLAQDSMHTAVKRYVVTKKGHEEVQSKKSLVQG